MGRRGVSARGGACCGRQPSWCLQARTRAMRAVRAPPPTVARWNMGQGWGRGESDHGPESMLPGLVPGLVPGLQCPRWAASPAVGSGFSRLTL